MSRSYAEIRDIIRQAREPLGRLDAAEKRIQEIEAGTFNYGAYIPKDLGDPVVVKRRGVTERSELIESILSWPLRPVVDLAKAGARAESTSDDLETFYAHWLLRGDPSTFHRSRIRNHMTRWRFGNCWLSVVEKNRPKRNQGESDAVYKLRIENWEQSYWRWQFNTLNPRTIGFLMRDGEVTLACIEEEVPIVDLTRYLDEGDDGMPYDLLRMRFPGLRSNDGIAPEDGVHWLNKTITRYTVDDGEQICHYIKQGGTGRDLQGRFDAGDAYVEVSEPYANTFGCPSLVIFAGTHRPHAPIEEQYEPLIAAHAEVEYKLTMMESIAMTVAGNPRWAEELDPAVGQQVMNLIASGTDPKLLAHSNLDQKDAQGHRVIASLYGELKDASRVLGEEFWRIYEGTLAQWDQLGNSLAAISPEMAEHGRAATVFAMLEARQSRFEKQQTAITAGITKMAYMTAHDIVHGLNPHMSKSGSSELDQAVEFYTTGKEYLGNKSVEAGQKKSFGPKVFAQFPEPASVSFEPIGTSDAQRAASVQIKLAMEAQGLATPGDVLEADGESDVSGKLVELAAWSRNKLLSPGFTKMGMLDGLKTIAIREGRDEMVLLGMFLPEFAGQPSPTEGQPSTQNGQSYSGVKMPSPNGSGA